MQKYDTLKYSYECFNFIYLLYCYICARAKLFHSAAAGANIAFVNQIGTVLLVFHAFT